MIGCGYRWQPNHPYGERPSISVPFIQGDEDGRLTTSIIHALSASGLADVKASQGDYQLQVQILGSNSEHIGYRVDPQKVDHKVRKNLLASEGRRSMTLEVSLCKGEKIVYGPYQMTGDAEYDYVDGDSIQDLTFTNPSGALVTVLPFSLGQLEPEESAQEAAAKPLYAHLAQKIVDAISSAW